SDSVARKRTSYTVPLRRCRLLMPAVRPVLRLPLFVAMSGHLFRYVRFEIKRVASDEAAHGAGPPLRCDAGRGDAVSRKGVCDVLRAHAAGVQSRKLSHHGVRRLAWTAEPLAPRLGWCEGIASALGDDVPLPLGDGAHQSRDQLA